MTEQKIKIEKVEMKIGRVSKKPYATINNKYTVHEKDVYRTLEDNVGKAFNLRIETSDDGKWHNIREILGQVEVEEVDDIIATPVKPGNIVMRKQTDDGTNKRCALNNAVNYTMHVPHAERDGKIMDLANAFYAWLTE